MSNLATLQPHPAGLFTSGQRAKEMGSRGGKAKTPLKKWTAKLREMKKKGLKDEIAKHFYDIMTDPESSTFYFMERLEANKNSLSTKDYLELLAKWHQMHHGSKLKVEKKSVEVMVGISDERAEEIVKSLLSSGNGE